jgi:hypothetical protein
MALTELEKSRVDYLRNSVRLQAPESETDPAYVFSDDDLFAILETVIPSHNPKYTTESLPSTEFHFAILLAKKEIYYRLATSTAPFYPLQAEGASLQKNVRFDHYLALVKQVEDDYRNSVAIAKENQFGEVQTFEALAQGKHFSLRNYNLSSNPTVKANVDMITSTTVNVDWTKFDGALFLDYRIFVEPAPIIDEYAEHPLSNSIEAKFRATDIHRTKYRITGLKPNSNYYVCVVSRDRNGLYGYHEQMVRTLSVM